MSSSRTSIKARTIAIIGAGPSGVIAAKYLRAERAFDRIVLFEQRSGPGGLWNYTPNQTDEDLFTVPQLDPKGKHQDPKWVDTSELPNGISKKDSSVNVPSNGTYKTPSFLTPMYEDLETNIPRSLMRFSDLAWPVTTQLFPHRESVLQYIASYSADVHDLVRYATQVTACEPTSSSPTTTWRVTTHNLLSKEKRHEVFDALIVANGHFNTPSLPAIPGLRTWHAAFPGSVSHAKYFRSASAFAGKKVVVVGNSASGADISAQIARQCAPPLLWSSRSGNMFSGTHGSAARVSVPEIKALDAGTRSVEFVDGRVERDVDCVVFCTGYLYSLPFLSSALQDSLVGDGTHVEHTYQHVFCARYPTLSFLALPQRVIPFPVAEAQAAVVARVYSGRLSLPFVQVMEEWYEKTLSGVGRRKDFHLLPFPRDGEYINMMSSWAASAEERMGLENDGKGKPPPVWEDWDFWCREKFPAIRAAFGELGAKKHGVTSVEEVGFVYENDVNRKDKEERTKTY